MSPVECRGVDRTSVRFNQQVRTGFEKADGEFLLAPASSPPNVQLRPVAVAPRVGGNGFDRAFPVDLADARESLPKNLDLVLNLLTGGNVLVVAPAAALKQRASGDDSIGGALAPLRHAGADQLWSLVKWLDFHLFAGKHKRNKRDVAVKPPKALAAINKLFDYNRRSHVSGYRAAPDADV